MKLLTSVALAVGVALTSCSRPPAFEDVYEQVTPTSISAGNPVPLPTDKTLLTVTGAVKAFNQGNEIAMDRSTIEAVGLVEYDVKDPFETEKRIFRGVLMRDLLEVWQVEPDATTLEWTALNDYKVSVPIQVVQDYPVLFALQQDGEEMKEDYRGPAMLVFPYDDYKFDHNVANSYWIWQIKSVNIQ